MSRFSLVSMERFRKMHEMDRAGFKVVNLGNTLFTAKNKRIKPFHKRLLNAEQDSVEIMKEHMEINLPTMFICHRLLCRRELDFAAHKTKSAVLKFAQHKQMSIIK